jgi:Peptidase M15
MAVLKTPLATCTLTTGKADKPETDTFECGVNLLSVEVQSGEGDRANSVVLTCHDPALKIAAKYRERSLKAGAIVVPKNLLEKADETAASGAAVELGKVSEGLKGDALARVLIQYCRANGVTDNSQIACVLGQISKETNMGEFLEEIDDGSNYAYLGTDAPYHGRGLIQLTGKANYQYASQKMGFDFIASPDALKQLKYAIPIAVRGCAEGWFTGRKLSGYGTGSTFDFSAARDIVNPGEGGSRRAQYVAYCQQYLARLSQLENGAGTVAQSGFTSIVLAAAAPLIDPTAAITPIALRKNTLDDRTTEITVDLGWNDSGERVSFSFWLTGVSTSTNLPPRTTLTGRGIRFLISSEKRRTTHKNISLRQLTQRIGDQYGVDVDIPVTTETERIAQKINQNGESDYQFLMRAAAAQGYLVQGDEQSKTLKLIAAGDKSVDVVKFGASWGASLDTRDDADSRRKLGELPPIISVADGEAIGEGYFTTLSLPYPTMAQLKLQPGQILDIGEDVVRKPFARQYRIKSLRWKWDGKVSGTVELYIPVNVEAKKSTAAADATTGTGAVKANVDPKIWQKGGTQYQIPGVGLVSASAEIIAGSGATWSDFTKNGSRIPSDPKIAEAALGLCQKLATVVRPALGNRVLRITSMYRDPSSNAAVGGASDSRHTYGDAVDFITDDQTPQQIMAILNPLWTFGGMSDYSSSGNPPGIVHLDCRGTRVRW